MNKEISIAECLAEHKRLFKTVAINGADGKLDKMRSIQDLSKDLKGYKDVEIILLGDIHMGNPTTWYYGVWAILKYAYQKENCFIILMGDSTDVGCSDGIRLLSEMILNKNNAQLAVMARYLRPLAKKGKILLSVNGNHNVNSNLYKDGFDIDQALVDQLNVVSTRTLPPTSFLHPIRIITGKYSYSFLVSHGYMCGGTSAARIRKVEDLNKMVAGCDIYAMAHGHGFVHSELSTHIQTDKEIRQSNGVYVMTPGYVQHGDNYLEKMLLSNNSILGSSSVTLAVTGKEKYIMVTPRVIVSEYLPTKTEFNKDQYEKFLES